MDARNNWNPVQESMLVSLRKKGAKWAEIAKAVKKTEHGARNKYRRLTGKLE